MREGGAPVRIKSQKFEPGERVELDGNSFEHCQFDKCVMLFRATSAVSFDDCSFNDVLWHFEGPASLTVQFMKAISEAAEDYGWGLIVNTFPILKDWIKPEILATVLGKQNV